MEQTRRAHSIMCHHFHNRGIHIPSQGSIDFNEFDALLQYYKKQGYSLIDAEEWMEKAISTSLRPNEVCISFDDGLKCQFDIAAEVLEKNDLTAFFFVPSQRFIGERENLELFRHFRFSQFADIDQFYHSFFRILEQSTIYKQKKWKSLLSKFKPEEYLSEFSFYTPADRKFRYIRDDLMTEQEYYDFMFEMMERFHYNVEEAEKNLYMNHAEITELHRKGHILGLHSHTHYTNLANVSKERQFWEFQTNQRILEEIILVYNFHWQKNKREDTEISSHITQNILLYSLRTNKKGVCVMNTIINEKEVTFKMLEENIFRMACEWARKVTTELLEAYDKRLMEERDKKEYRNKGKRNTTVKTIYGEVSYQRNIYECHKENGQKEYHYLLDEALKMKNVGLFSEQVSTLLIEGITVLSYRECSKKISEMTGLSISPMGVWNVVQTIGEKLCEEEAELVQAHKEGKIAGEKESKVLFEEIDGVYVSLQGKDRKKKRTKAEIKVGITYEGWKETGKNRRNLVGKLAVAGFSNSKDFHNYREATIASEYNLDETEIRLLNGDGASWIRKVKDKNTIFQLDPFHRNKAIKETIKEKAYVAEIHRYLKEKNIEGMFEYLDVYRNSLTEEQEIEKVENLIEYLRKNQKGLLSYKERGIELPAADNGIKYCEMGTMENHIWGIIARRMKHNHSTWSIRGGNHLAKILAKRESGTLKDVVKKVERNYIETSLIEEWQEDILMAGQIKKKVGKGYEYGLKGHLTLLNHSSGITRAFALNLIG